MSVKNLGNVSGQRRLRILFVVPSLQDVASVRYAVDLAESLSLRGHTIEIWHLSPQKEITPQVSAKWVSLWRLHDLKLFDVIHSHGLRPDLFAFINGFTSRRVRRVSTLHSLIWDDLGSLYSPFIARPAAFFWKVLLSIFSRVVVLNECAAQMYSSWIKSARIRVVHSGLPKIEELRPTEEVRKATDDARKKELIVIGTAARLVSLKGIDQIFELLRVRSDLFFVLLGRGPLQSDFQMEVLRSGLDNRVFFAGHVLRAARDLQLFDICVVPSRSEGFCFTLLEAIQLKVPVVCSSIPVFHELYNESHVSFFELDNLDSFSAAIDEALASGKVKASSAYAHYKENYTLEAMVDRYQHVYNEVLPLPQSVRGVSGHT